MTQNWKDPAVAKAWDEKGDATNPTRPEQLDILLSLLEGLVQPDDWILDLGYGSGKVEELMFSRMKSAKVVGVDSSSAMADLAAKRLQAFDNTFLPAHGDLAQLSQLQLPVTEYGAIIAIQSLHHLSEQAMQSAYQHIYTLLRQGGVFLLLDRTKVENESLFPLYRTLWRRLDSLGASVAEHEGHDFNSHEENVQNRGDYPVELDRHLKWLRASGFDAAVLHVHGNRALVGAVKAATDK